MRSKEGRKKIVYNTDFNSIMRQRCVICIHFYAICVYAYYLRIFATNIKIIAMGTTHSLDRVIKPKTEYSMNKENKLQKILRSKDSIQLTAKQYESYRLSAYAPVR